MGWRMSARREEHREKESKFAEWVAVASNAFSYAACPRISKSPSLTSAAHGNTTAAAATAGAAASSVLRLATAATAAVSAGSTAEPRKLCPRAAPCAAVSGTFLLLNAFAAPGATEVQAPGPLPSKRSHSAMMGKGTNAAASATVAVRHCCSKRRMESRMAEAAACASDERRFLSASVSDGGCSACEQWMNSVGGGGGKTDGGRDGEGKVSEGKGVGCACGGLGDENRDAR